MNKSFNIYPKNILTVTVKSKQKNLEFITYNKSSVKQIEHEILMKLNLKKRELVTIRIFNCTTRQVKNYRKWIG